MKIKFLLCAALLFLLSLSGLLLTSCKNPTPTKINTTRICFKTKAETETDTRCITAEIADTPAQRATGLMYRESLDKDKGMLFVFDRPSIYQFWMKNTLIPLDMIFLDTNKKIISIEHATPCKAKKCPKYGPMQDSLYVIEVKSGFTDEFDIGIGETVTFETP